MKKEEFFPTNHVGNLEMENEKLKNKVESKKSLFYDATLCIFRHEKLEDGIKELFSFLKKFFPITYILYMPPYGSQSKHIYISKNEFYIFNNTISPTLLQMKKILEHQKNFNNIKIKYLKYSDTFNVIKNLMHEKLDIQFPFLYFYFVYDGRIQGSMCFGCNEEKEFSEDEIELLSVLWEPMLFITRFYYQQNDLEKILQITQENNRTLREQASGFKNIIGMNSGLSSVAREIRLIAPFDISVLLIGETGTGKDLFASEIHRLSPRNGKPFVAVNCGGITSTLIDSELFGYDKGAFTGAYKDYKGRFERANGGTIFLDEIGELPLEEQTRLLRVIQNRTVERVGGSEAIPVDFRLVCATNKDLPAMVRAGTFREDLYFRIAGVRIRIPPLRDRPSDILPLVQHVLNREAVRYGVTPPLIADGEMHKLLNYAWPGNVRELVNVVTEGFVRSLPDRPAVFHVGIMEERSADVQREDIRTYSDMQREYFQKLLQACGGKISGPLGAADLAGMKPNTLRAKLDKLGVPYGRSREAPGGGESLP